MKQAQTIELPPNPAFLIQSMRCIGYTLETALADIIDNSITAHASKISVRYQWDSGKPWIAILDDGCGMSAAKLREAMRFGGDSSSLDTRDAKDLGRFGLGLKTASLSQSRLLTIFSKQHGVTSVLSWDLDFLTTSRKREWIVRVPALKSFATDSSVASSLAELAGYKTGTIVLWQKIDAIVSDEKNQTTEKHFSHVMARASEHIRTTFHRFLTPDDGSRSVSVDFNGTPLSAFNPFGVAVPARMELPAEDIRIDGQSIHVQAYVLPHCTKSSRPDYEKFAGEDGYRENQGFYIYRNRRLILKGTWFRLLPRTEITKLLRVRVDIPNTLDHLWQLDVKKAQAHPPQIVLAELKRFIGRIENSGRQVYTRRAQKAEDSLVHVWRREFAEGKVAYVINEEHPFVKLLIEDESGVPDNQKLSALRVISGAFPRDAFHLDANNDKVEIVPAAKAAETYAAVRSVILVLRGTGLDPETIRVQLAKSEIPVSAEDLETLLKEVFNG
jgi:hypothetical protein